MMKSGTTMLILLAAVLFHGAPAEAASLVFGGTLNATGTAAPDPSCAPLPLRGTVLPANSAGSSSLGAFSYGHSACILGAAGPLQGSSFVFDFGLDQFSGTFAGLGTASATPGLFDVVLNYTVLGGTGRFLGATGAFTGIGTIDARNPPARHSYALDGLIDAPAVPEPGTWLTMLAGFGILGGVMRRRRTRILATA